MGSVLKFESKKEREDKFRKEQYNFLKLANFKDRLFIGTEYLKDNPDDLLVGTLTKLLLQLMDLDVSNYNVSSMMSYGHDRGQSIGYSSGTFTLFHEAEGRPVEFINLERIWCGNPDWWNTREYIVDLANAIAELKLSELNSDLVTATLERSGSDYFLTTSEFVKSSITFDLSHRPTKQIVRVMINKRFIDHKN